MQQSKEITLIKPALAFRQPKLPKSWHELPSGDKLLRGIEMELADWLPKFFGYHLLKVGELSTQINTLASPIKHQVNIVSNVEQQIIDQGVVADIDDLPFLEHSVDVCVLSHALEFSLDPHHVIREANRVLIPNGYMVITGYNPFSAVGLNKLVPYRRNQFPWNERFFSPNRIKDWLHLMGYETLADQRFFIDDNGDDDSKIGIAKYWKKFINNYFTCFGSAYVIIAKKRRHPLTPIKPKWQIRPNFKPVNVSSMNANNCEKRK